MDEGRLAALARRIDPQAKLLRAWELKGGVSAQVTAFAIEHADGRVETLVVRRHGARDRSRNPKIAADELRLLTVVVAAGVPAPAPRYLDAAGEIFGVPSLVLDHVDGELSPADLDDTVLVRELAQVLVAIHRIPAADMNFLPQRVSALPERNRPVLLHGDFWPGNTLWRDGRLAAVIDWEDAAIGDPLADVANARLELLWARGPDAMEGFTRRYEATAGGVDMTDLPHWDLWAGSRLFDHLAEWGLEREKEDAMRADYEAFVAQAREKLSS